ncbi:Two-component system histidine kinase DccS [hydrothermal vent metagenome]|uniref:histidine kinase n=1 Tax=hydrothermal vent metagenome TaxID=652676 RepID=A0A1W1EHE2_9ZZZZ
MNSKKRVFYIFNISIVISIITATHFTILYFNASNNLLFSIFIISIFTILYSILNKSFIDDIFKIDKNLKYKIEKTMHEINTPVATIAINTEILQTKLNNTQNLKRLDRIEKSCEYLLRLYEDMEYYIKKETNNIEIVEFDLKELLERCLDKFEDLKNDIKISLDIEDILIKSDRNGFEEMISNLISNAIKHNSSISTIQISLNKNILTFKDDGEGITTKDLYMVFDKYFQSSDEVKGFGIGLNMVKEFCDREKLDIKINSSSEGTIFYINLENIIVGG